MIHIFFVLSSRFFIAILKSGRCKITLQQNTIQTYNEGKYFGGAGSVRKNIAKSKIMFAMSKIQDFMFVSYSKDVWVPSDTSKKVGFVDALLWNH